MIGFISAYLGDLGKQKMRIQSSNRLAALGLSAWFGALLVAVFIADVPPWHGVGAVIVGIILFFRRFRERLRIALVAMASAPILLPALVPDRPDEGGWPVWVLLMVSTSGWFVDEHRRWRLAVSWCVLIVSALLCVKQAVVTPLLPVAIAVVPGLAALGISTAALTMSAPPTRWAGLALVLVGGVTVGQGILLSREAAEMPIDHAAKTAAAYRGWWMWPAIEERTLASVRSGDMREALEVIRLAPTRTTVGEAFTDAFGPRLPVKVGWEPAEALRSELAVQVAWELESQGYLGRGVNLLRRNQMDGEVAFHLSALAAELGETSLAEKAAKRAVVPAGVVSAPGVILRDVDLFVDDHAAVLFAVPQTMSTVIITALRKSSAGNPKISARLGKEVWGPVSVSDSGSTTWVWKRALSSGAYRLMIKLHTALLPDEGQPAHVVVSVEVR
jgi:hypothetical protein